MPIYQVEVCRTGYGNNVLDIEANSEEEAHEKALDQAGNYYYSEHSSEYEVIDSWEKKDD